MDFKQRFEGRQAHINKNGNIIDAVGGTEIELMKSDYKQNGVKRSISTQESDQSQVAQHKPTPNNR